MDNSAYLFLSVVLSAGRNITSKKAAVNTNEKSQFFLSQTILFASATVLLLLFCAKNLTKAAHTTLIFGMVYGALLILSQWMLTLALKNGNTSVCSVVYSLGFILPTVFGTLFWNEEFKATQIIGVLGSLVIILLTARRDKTEKKQGRRIFVPCILIAMISSGGLGIMQKVQQSFGVADEKGIFLLIAFCFAFCCSLVAFLLSCEKTVFGIKNAIYPTLTGLFFGGANFCNTSLAGKMKSAVLFPLQNISTILVTTLLGVLIFKEKMTLKTAIILTLSMAVIVLFSLE